MKLVRSLLLVVLVAPALVAIGASSALACSCIPPRPDPKALKDAKAVFSGTVVDVEDGVEIGFDPVTWTFAVDTIYKGDVAERQQVTSHTQSAACGFVFKEEQRYVVFAHDGEDDPRSDTELATSSCSNTRRLKPDQVVGMRSIATFGEMDGLGPGAAAAGEDAASERASDRLFVVASLGFVAVFAVLTLVALARGRGNSD